ncbi:MAG TPA: hypothetical protein VHO03_12705 [Ignavibacteriales bacterium]|nr:hypothetical protein [Ignavibacteriales bacterium]
MQLRRVSIMAVFSFLACSLIFAHEGTLKDKETQKAVSDSLLNKAPYTVQTKVSKTKKITRRKSTKSGTSYYRSRKYPHQSPNWQMERLKNREKFTEDWINHLQQELSQYEQERTEIRKGMKNVISKDIQEKIEAKEKLQREQQEQLRARDKEIEALQQKLNAIDTTK